MDDLPGHVKQKVSEAEKRAKRILDNRGLPSDFVSVMNDCRHTAGVLFCDYWSTYLEMMATEVVVKVCELDHHLKVGNARGAALAMYIIFSTADEMRLLEEIPYFEDGPIDDEELVKILKDGKKTKLRRKEANKENDANKVRYMKAVVDVIRANPDELRITEITKLAAEICDVDRKRIREAFPDKPLDKAVFLELRELVISEGW